VGFAGEVLKGVIAAKLSEGESSYKGWIEEAKKKTKERAEERKKSPEDAEDVDMVQ
jgi:ubiquitin carboxyl-terminal hydrolase L5